jgi:hypothetical protein
MGHIELDRPTEGSDKLSGSKRPKTKLTKGQHDVTNGRVTEMIELAMVLTNHPDAAEAKTALARIANELLKEGADATIDQAIEAAPSCGIAQTIRYTAEAASEHTVIYRKGVTEELSLFAIPIITAFEQYVPASQFETALIGFTSSKSLTSSMEHGRSKLEQMMLLPTLFRLDDLKSIPLSVVRNGAICLGTTSRNRGARPDPFVTQVGSFKRSTAFLRYLVGQRLAVEHECASRAFCIGGLLQDLTKQVVERRLGLPCNVQILCTGSFHESLYSGMWSYQEKRLDHLARASRAQTRTKKPLEARVATHGHRHRFDMRVGFFVENEAIGGRAYRLSSRPSEDPSKCASRISSRLEAAGIKTKVLAGFVPEEMGFTIQTGRKLHPSMIATPI